MMLRFIANCRAAGQIVEFLQEAAWRNYLEERVDCSGVLMEKVIARMGKQINYKKARF